MSSAVLYRVLLKERTNGRMVCGTILARFHC
jgi:hypothetical protein